MQEASNGTDGIMDRWSQIMETGSSSGGDLEEELKGATMYVPTNQAEDWAQEDSYVNVQITNAINLVTNSANAQFEEGWEFIDIGTLDNSGNPRTVPCQQLDGKLVYIEYGGLDANGHIFRYRFKIRGVIKTSL